MPTSGIELATEWVTILPETAELVKRLKKFHPPDIPVNLVISENQKKVESGVVKPVEKAAKKAGEAFNTQMGKAGITAGESAGQGVGQGLAKTQAPVQAAAKKAGETIRKEVVDSSEKAGKEGMDKMAKAIASKKDAVARAERAVADARRNEANIESRIRAIEEKIQQYRKQTATLALRAAEEEKLANQMRSASEKKTADDIAAQEAKATRARQQHMAMLTRLNSQEEARGRLTNTQESASNRTANAVDRVAAAEMGLAGAVAARDAKVEDGAKTTDKGTSAFGRMTAGLIPLAKQLLITTGLFTGALGLGGAITSILRTGNQYTDAMNLIKGVTNATGEQMTAISEKARDLGRDISLPATSANDAALAMLELTKAGFSVQQAMDAAKGSLQLSAAAGVTASEAAKVTGTTLNAYGLEAKDAARVTDILANAANMFPGEMTDFAYSLSQGGAVAKSFGISLEDTTVALGFLAKAGIKSSDAGTLIKTMLLSLTDQGKPAQKAIHTLGLELYDQQGKFKGMEYVFKRLTEVSKTMTQEQYQAATATLFGTDAARFSGMAAGMSAAQWDDFRGKILRVGTASDVAAARMQGLPGALHLLKNAAESLGLTIYDSIKGPLNEIIRSIANVVLAFDGFLRGGGVMRWLKEWKDELIAVGTVLAAWAGYLIAIKIAQMAATAATWLFQTAMWALDAAMDANPVGVVIIALAALVAGIIYAYKHSEAFRNMVDGVGRALKKAWIDNWPTIQKVLQEMGKMWNWLYENVLKPVGHFIGFVFEGYIKSQVAAWKNIYIPILKVVWEVLKGLWQNVLMPIATWMIQHLPQAIQGAKILWAGLVQVFNDVKETIMWVWHTILEPFVDFMIGVFKVIWTNWQIQWAIGKAIFTAIAATAMWLWHNVFEPGWNFAVDLFKASWDIIKGIFDFFTEAWKTVGIAAMNFWEQWLQPVWDGIKSGFSALWDFIKPIFDKFGLSWKTLGEIASEIGTQLKNAWNGLMDVMKMPLHGLGDILAGIPDEFLGVHLDFAGDIRGWGKTLQKLATGGVAGVNGRNVLYGPGTGTSDDILALNDSGVPTARVSNGEGVVPAKALGTPLGMRLFTMLLNMASGGIPPGGDSGGVGQPKLPKWWEDLLGNVPINNAWMVDPKIGPELPWMVPAKKWGGILPGFKGGGLTRDILDRIAVEKFGLELGSGDRAEAGSHHNTPGGARDYNSADRTKLERFANWLATGPLRPYIDQEIFQAPSGKKYGIAGGKIVGPDLPGTTDTGYYSRGKNDWADHTDHVHVGFGEVSKAFQGDVLQRQAGKRKASKVDAPTLTTGSSKEDVARKIIAEAAKKGWTEPQTIAALATAMQESGLSPTAQGGGGAWHGIFQQDKSYAGRDDPNKNIEEFFSRVKKPEGEGWDQIFELQQGTSSKNPAARLGYMGEIKSQLGAARALYSSVGGADITGGGGDGDFGDIDTDALGFGDTGGGRRKVDAKKVREAEDRVEDRERQLKLAQERLDEYKAKQAAGETVKQSTIDSAQGQVDKFTRELSEAKSDLETAKQGKLEKGKKGKRGSGDDSGGDSQWESVGGMIFKGFLEEIGLDGSWLTNLFDTPNVKSAMAGLNFGMNMLFGDQDGSDVAGDYSSGAIGGDGADLGGILAGIGDAAGLQLSAPAGAADGGDADQAGYGGGGPNFDLRGANLGVNPADFTTKIEGMTAATKRYPNLRTV